MSRAIWLLILCAACCVLSGCPWDATVRPVEPPKVVYVTVTKYVPVPEELSKDCPIAEPETLKVLEAVDVANMRKTSLKNCNADKKAIRNLPLTPPPTPGGP